jgi:hypothetical protein
MNKAVLIVVIFLSAFLNSTAQKVFSCDYKSDANVKKIVANYKSDADLVVYKCDYKSGAVLEKLVKKTFNVLA